MVNTPAIWGCIRATADAIVEHRDFCLWHMRWEVYDEMSAMLD